MGRISQETSDKINFLSLAGAVCVCALHVPWPRGSMAKDLFNGLLVATLPTALAFFFAFSGYFLARHWQEPGWWRRALVKRVFTLAAPYFIWLLAFICLFTFIRPDFSFFHYDDVASVLGFVPWNPPRLVPYWFMRCLFVFVLVSPLVVKAVDVGRGMLLTASVCALDLVYWTLVALRVIGMETPVVGSLFWYGFNIDGFVYFTLGVQLAMRPFPKPGVRAVRVCGCVAALLIAADLVCLRFPWFGDVYPAAVIMPFLAVFIWGVLPAWKIPSLFRGVMFPVYLLHVIVLETYCYFRGWDGHGLCECLLILALEFFVPVFFCQAIRRWTPRLSAILFGGR